MKEEPTSESGSVKSSRVATELTHIISQMMSGSLFSILFKGLFSALVVWAAGLMMYYAQSFFMTPPACVNSCFSRSHDSCCSLHYLFLCKGFLVILAIALSSFFLTKYTKHQRLIFSAMTTALVLISSAVFFIYLKLPPLTILVSLLFIFIAMLVGYRLAILKRS